ncbi:MAG: hypothetical protein ACR2PZ_00820 [Pseudomonadales bacterium]
MRTQLIGSTVIITMVMNSYAWGVPAIPRAQVPADIKAVMTEQLAGVGPARPSTPAQLADARGVAYRVADQYAPENFYIDDLVDKLEYEPLQAFQFVRDRIGLEPYQGVMRGAEGTLAAAAGNSYDRALLLQRLLDDMGYETRLAYGELDSAITSRQSFQSQLFDNAGKHTDPTALMALAGFGGQLKDRMLSRARRDYGLLRPHVNSQSAPKPSSLSGSLSHIWVQAKLESEWTDLDTSFSKAEPGQRFAEVTKYAKAPEPGELQQITLTVIGEALSGTTLKESVLLQHSLSAQAAQGAHAYLYFQPKGGGGLGATLEKALGPQDFFVPALSIDGEIVSGSAMPGIRQADAEKKDFFFGNSSLDELAGLYLDVTLAVPGQPPTTERRILLDRLSAQTRLSDSIDIKSLHEVPATESVPIPMQTVHQILFSNGGYNPNQVATDVGLGMYFAGEYLSDDDAFESLPLDSILWPVSTQRIAALAANERLLTEALNDQQGLRFFFPSPRVYIYSLSIGDNNDPAPTYTVDLLHDPIEAVAVEGIKAAQVFDRRVWHGILQSAFENTWIEGPMLLMTGQAESMHSASAALTGKISKLDGTDKSALKGLNRALRQDLGTGATVLLSSNPTDKTPAWWRISKDGTTKAMLGFGLGGAEGSPLWYNYTNARPPGYHYISEAETNRLFNNDSQTEYKRQVRRAMKELKQSDANKKFEKKHSSRVSRAGHTPKTGGSCARGGTEYSITQCISTWILNMSAVSFMALIIVSVVFVALVLLKAFTVIASAAMNQN